MIWTPERIGRAERLWSEGSSATVIARALDVSRSAVLGLANRNRDRFPSREALIGRRSPVAAPKAVPGSVSKSPARRPRRDTARARAQERECPAPVFAPVFAPAEPRRSAMDLCRYRLEGVSPVPFADLGNRQCRFPLECLETVSGPQTPCCGAPTSDLAFYCAGHRSVMYARAA